MFQTVHEQRGGDHQNPDQKYRGKNLVALFFQNVGDDAERVVVLVSLEQMQNAHHAQHTERYRAGREEHGNKKYHDGQQVDDTKKGTHEPKFGLQGGLFRVEVFRCPEAKQIFCRKNHDGEEFYRIQRVLVRGSFLKGAEQGDKQIDKNRSGKKNINKTV